MSVNCAQAPMKMSHGLLNNMRKSSVDRVSPIVSIITPSMTLDTSPLTHPNTSGTRKAKTAAAITYVDECEAIHALTSFTISFIIVKKTTAKVLKR